MDLNPFDLFALTILVFAIIAGIRTGALPQVGGIIGALAVLVLLFQLAPWLLDVTKDMEPLVRAIVVLGAVLGGVVAGEALGSALGHTVADSLGTGVISGLDRAAGGLVGAAQAVLIIWLAGGLLAVSGLPTLGRAAANSTAVSITDRFLPATTEVVGEIAGVIDASGLPDVFVGLEPAPLAPVDTPSDPKAAAIARAAIPSTARVTSRACDTQVTGTGIVVAPGYIVTNAHVVAGTSDVRIELPSGDADATVVLFDPKLDVALLYAPRADAPAMRFSNTDPRARHGRRGARLRARRPARRPARRRHRQVPGAGPRHHRQDARDARHPRAPRRGRARGLGRAADPRGRHDRRARVRGVAHGRQRGLRAHADERRGPDPARDRPDRRGRHRCLPSLTRVSVAPVS